MNEKSFEQMPPFGKQEEDPRTPEKTEKKALLYKEVGTHMIIPNEKLSREISSLKNIDDLKEVKNAKSFRDFGYLRMLALVNGASKEVNDFFLEKMEEMEDAENPKEWEIYNREIEEAWGFEEVTLDEIYHKKIDEPWDFEIARAKGGFETTIDKELNMSISTMCEKLKTLNFQFDNWEHILKNLFPYRNEKCRQKIKETFELAKNLALNALAYKPAEKKNDEQEIKEKIKKIEQDLEKRSKMPQRA